MISPSSSGTSPIWACSGSPGCNGISSISGASSPIPVSTSGVGVLSPAVIAGRAFASASSVFSLLYGV
ncbi:hypothetical protein [Dysgonomonas reticulitermitis]